GRQPATGGRRSRSSSGRSCSAAWWLFVPPGPSCPSSFHNPAGRCAVAAYIEVEGLKEFNRAVRAAKDKQLDKRIGQANKKIGQLVIDRLSPSPDPRAIGAGRGATVRPSASKREVL